MQKEAVVQKKEIRGIYNVTFNEKPSTPILHDIVMIENTVIAYIAMYVKGYHSFRNDRGFGAKHIKLHLEKGSGGEIRLEELLNLGNSLRAYSRQFGEAFVDEKNAKIFEWQDKNGVRFRAVADKIRREGDNCHSTSPDDIIISFYSDRNLKERMEFKNPKVREYYENLQNIDSQIAESSATPRQHKRKL